MRPRPAVLALAALLVPAALAAQAPAPADTLTLLEAASRALASHPSVAAAEAGQAGAEAARGIADADWWPHLALDGSWTRFQEPMLVTPLHSFDLTHLPVFSEDVVQGTLSAKWSLFEGGARLARSRRAGALVDAAEAGVEATRQALLAGVANAYLDVVVAREQLAAHDARMTALAAERDRVVLALEHGTAAKVDLARVDAARARADAARTDAVAALEVAAGDLARWMGADEPDSLAARVALPAIEPAPTADSLGPREAPAGNSAVARARAEARAAAAAAAAARAAWLPNVDATGAYVERGAGTDPNTYTGEWQVGLQLRYPLFTGGARRAEVSRATAERERADAATRQAELDAAAAAQRARAALSRATARRDAYAEAVARSEEVARVERLALDVGTGVQSDWLTAEADLLEARAGLAAARADVVRAAIERARVAGDLSLEWIRSVSR